MQIHVLEPLLTEEDEASRSYVFQQKQQLKDSLTLLKDTSKEKIPSDLKYLSDTKYQK